MSLLKEQKYIPSISFGYTAGAPYRSTGELASLTLGGYDSSKYIDNDVTFTFASDDERDIVVSIQSISTPSQIKSSPSATELLPSPIYAYMDATVAQIWLPIDACYVFEYEFGLVYDNTTDLYLVNNTLHQQLLDRNASITFQLGSGLNGGDTVSIELPYAAFDLTAKPPYQYLTNQTSYFPLRRAVNESQYTIGRAFFQEAYIAIDYEAQKFNISQRAWSLNAQPHLVAIPPYSGKESSSGLNSGSGSSSLSGGAIAGIVVGAVAILTVLGLLLLLLSRRRRSRRNLAARKAAEREKLGSDAASTENSNDNRRGQQETVIPKAELPGSTPPRQDDSDESHLLAAGALSAGDSSSGSGSGTPRTRNALSGSTFLGGRGGSISYSPTAESSGEGSGTHSSTDSPSQGHSTIMSIVSPLSPGGSQEPVEMPGDMPTIREKDGNELTEKQALAHRERVYNGVDTPPQSAVDNTTANLQPPRRVDPADVVMSGNVIGSENERGNSGRHRAFSFEDNRPNEETPTHNESSQGSEDLYS